MKKFNLVWDNKIIFTNENLEVVINHAEMAIVELFSMQYKRSTPEIIVRNIDNTQYLRCIVSDMHDLITFYIIEDEVRDTTPKGTDQDIDNNTKDKPVLIIRKQGRVITISDVMIVDTVDKASLVYSQGRLAFAKKTAKNTYELITIVKDVLPDLIAIAEASND